jgi:hypothetical protein
MNRSYTPLPLSACIMCSGIHFILKDTDQGVFLLDFLTLSAVLYSIDRTALFREMDVVLIR